MRFKELVCTLQAENASRVPNDRPTAVAIRQRGRTIDLFQSGHLLVQYVTGPASQQTGVKYLLEHAVRVDELDFLPPKNESLSSYIADEVTRLIVEGKITPGTHIKEVELANALKTSRSPVREAISQLVSENVLVRKPNRGVFLNFPSRKEQKDICDTRMLFEQYAVKVLIKKQDKAIIADLNKQLYLYEKERAKKRPNLKLMRQYDYGFHRKICEYCDNSIVLSSWENLLVRMNIVFLIEGIFLENMDASYKEHKEILEAIKANDADKASELIENHLLRTYVSYDKVSNVDAALA